MEAHSIWGTSQDSITVQSPDDMPLSNNSSKQMPDFSKIRAFAFDVDGVFTDGGILCDLKGELYRTFDSKDGFGVRMAIMNGYPCSIITGGRSGSIVARFRSCGIKPEDVYLGSRDKILDFNEFCKKYNVSANEVLYVGDDIPDIEVMQACGIGVSPADGVPEALAAADFVSPYPGGRGCVRDVIERVMRSQGKWTFDVSAYKANF